MARTSITKSTLQGPYPTLPVTASLLDLTFQAADVANKNQFVSAGDDILLAWNTGASAYTVTFSSVADDKKRTGDVSAYSIGAGEIAAFRFKDAGWKQSDGKIYIEAENSAVKFAVAAL